MTNAISSLLDQLQTDPWRQEKGFSSDIETVHTQIFQSDISDGDIVRILNNWIAGYQPCLFGRIGARLGLISYCILSETDLEQSDSHIRDKIQEARLKWLKEALDGGKSAFVILAASEKIAKAEPSAAVEQLARQLCSHYLLKEVDTNRIYLDAIELEIGGRRGSRWRWDVGVNYFCAQGDQRWWQDHRIPGGMAFSMNSVGHMVRSGRLAGAMKVFEKAMEVSSEGWRHPSINSLEQALAYAMKTIDNASEAISGRATELLPLVDRSQLIVEKCPALPEELADKNCCEYVGFYHTDYTLPSEYFIPAIERPEHIEPRKLDFTYLFDERLSNPDYVNMGVGRQVGAEDENATSTDLTTIDRAIKRGRAAGKIVLEE